MGLEPFDLDEFESGEVTGDFLGSLYTYTSGYSQSSVLKNNPDKVSYWRPIRDFVSRIYQDQEMTESTSYAGYVISSKIQSSNKYLAFIGGDNPLMKISTDVGNGKSIVVIKESYGNAFVPFLVNHYEEVYVIDPRRWNHGDLPDFDLVEFVEDNSIDDVLVIDYPLVVSNQAYINYLNDLVS